MMANVLKWPGTSAKGPGTGAIRIVLHHHVGALRRAIRRWRPGLCMRDGEMLMCPTNPRAQSDGDRGHGSSPPRAGAAGPPRRVRIAERTLAESTGSLRAALARRMHKARSTLATILVVLAAVLLSPLHAQAQTTFVSNLNQPSEGNLSNVQDRAQSFTTGTHAPGYTLSSIVVGYNGGGTFAGSVWTANASGAAIARKHSLTAPSSFSAGDLTFTAPANATLDAETTYTVVMELSTSQGVTFKRTSTVNPNEDSGAAAGWSIGDTYHYLGASWTASGSDKPILIAIKGTAKVTGTNSPATGQPSIQGTPQLRSRADCWGRHYRRHEWPRQCGLHLPVGPRRRTERNRHRGRG